MRTILVVEDDASIRQGLVDALAAGGFAAIECEDGTTGLQRALSVDIDLALVDVKLPGMDGFSLVEEVRKSKPSLPIIMVTALGGEGDRVRGLRAGADDYVVKSNFSVLELLERIKAVLRRSAERPETIGTIELAGCSIDLERRAVTFDDGRKVLLQNKVAELLQYMASCRGRPISRDELLQRVWGLDARGVTTRTIDMHVSRLRKDLGDASGDVIKTVRGKGYMLV